MSSQLLSAPRAPSSPTQPFLPASGRRRLAAAGVDLFLLWLVGEILALLFLDEWIALGRSGRLIGALFFLAYLGGQNSTLRQGRTLGKRLLRLRTVSSTGGSLSLERSLARAALLVAPPLLHGLFVYPGAAVVAMASNALFFAVSWGWGVALLFSYLRSSQSGQALHDRILGSAVVYEGPCTHGTPVRPVLQPFRFGVVLPAWLASMAAMGAMATCLWGACGHWQQVVRAQHAAGEIEGALRAEVYRGMFFFRSTSGNIQRMQFAQVTVTFRAPVEDAPAMAREIAQRVLPALGRDLDAVRITVAWEFDLLVARRTWGQSFVQRPADWENSEHLALRVARSSGSRL